MKIKKSFYAYFLMFMNVVRAYAASKKTTLLVTTSPKKVSYTYIHVYLYILSNLKAH